MKAPEKSQNFCQLKNVLDKTLVTCLLEGKCKPEKIKFRNGTIIFRSPKTKDSVIKFLKNNVKNC